MSASPKVSIVTPTRNMAQYLQTAICSVAYQDYANLEYLVVDGGNDAETPALIERHHGVVSRYVREQDDGQSNAINKGWKLSSGEIFAWLNADDYYYPEVVPRVVGLFHDHPEVDVIYGQAVFVDTDCQFIRYFTEVEAHDLDRLRAGAIYICQPTVFARRSALARVDFLKEDLHFGMDWDLWCRLAASGAKFHYERTLLAAVRTYPETKTFGGGWPRIRELVKIQASHAPAALPRSVLAWTVAELQQRERKGFLVDLAARALRPALAAKRALLGRRPIEPLYGLHHHSSDAQREVMISLPLPEALPREIELTVSLPEGLREQQVQVEANGTALGTVVLDEQHATRRETLPWQPESDARRLDLGLISQCVHEVRGREACMRLEGVEVR
jgi:glycosyltransferase involved in cell wall biosynthesis